MADFRTDPVTVIDGVGKVRAEQLHQMGIDTVLDLLKTFPRAYQDRGSLVSLCEAAMLGEKCAMILTVGSEVSTVRLKNGRMMQKFTVFDQTGKCSVVFFNNAYIRSVFRLGGEFRFWGKVERIRNAWYLTCPEYEPFSENRPLDPYFPIYPLTSGITQKFMQGIVKDALRRYGDDLPEVFDGETKKKYDLPDVKTAFSDAHKPMSLKALSGARRYFAIRDLYLFGAEAALYKNHRQKVPAPVLSITDADLALFESRLPFALTGAQKRAIGEIRSDLSEGYAMHRIVIGDVGCGKTVVAAAALYIAVRAGYQATLMAPTEILARQHFSGLPALLAPLGVKTALLVGSMTAREKKNVRDGLADGGIDLAIGTHALFSAGVTLKKAALSVTDEQHRFGAEQRKLLFEKSGQAHSLVMSATPIPHTLALTLYGDLSLSLIDEMPAGRQKVSTFLVDETYLGRLEGFIVKEASEGKQIYVVCPAIEEVTDEDGEKVRAILPDGSDAGEGNLRSAVQYARELSDKYPALSVACMHGRMKGEDKDLVMRKFADGEISVLVSTTVIEVGVNVPNATLMVVFNADRFGLSQLHQLRGRVGRGRLKSYCILVSDTKSENSRARLEDLCKNTDGFAIAKADLMRRGPGDFFGSPDEQVRQHGNFSLLPSELESDPTITEDVFARAGKRVGEDPALALSENAALKAELSDKFGSPFFDA